MIQSREDYLRYLKADQKALNKKGTLKQRLFDRVWKFQRALRRHEFYLNTRKPLMLKILAMLAYKRHSYKLGFTIPPNVFGPSLAIAHYGTIVVSSSAKIGANCRIHVCVNIGTAAGASGDSPQLGDNCYIGPGAKLFGKIEIGDNTVIGANAVVNKSVPEGHCTLGGIPARVISEKDSEGLLIKGYEV